MPIEVELPDGSVAEFPDGTPPEAMKTAIAKRFPAKPEFSAMGEVTAPFAGFNKGLDALLNLPGTALNLGAQAVNYGAEKLGYDAPLPDQPFEPVSVATQANVGYEPQTIAGRYAESVGEAAGASVLPEAAILNRAGRLLPRRAAALPEQMPQAVRAAAETAAPVVQRAAQAGPGATLAAAAVPTVGAGIGVQAARDADLGPWGELAGGLLGGLAGPVAYVPAARAAGGLKNAVRYANDQVRAARDPETAAIQRTADSMVASRTPPSEIRSRLLSDEGGEPILSAELTGRGITEAHLADIISRRLGGESAEAIGREYGIAPGTVNAYVARFNRQTPTPLTIPDIVTEMRGPGGAMPLMRQGRAAFGIAEDAADAAEALIGRQSEQPGRTASIIQQSGGRRGALDEIRDNLAGTAREEERQAYGLVRQQAQPVEIADVLREARGRAANRGGEIGETVNRAVDQFFEPELRQPQQQPMTALRITEAEEAVQNAIAQNASPERISRLQRRLDTLREQDQFTRALRETTIGQPTRDVSRFIDARQELDQMISRSMQDGRATPLTAELTTLRNALNAAARRNNPALTAADARFYGNRTAERIIERGTELGKRLTPDTREATRDFRDMTPTQQELFRVAFEQRLADDALNTRQMGGAANQFSHRGFREIVEAFYPAPRSNMRGEARAAQQAVYERGQALLRNLNREAISTGTTNFMTGRANSPTAPWQNDIQTRMQNAQAAADLATGRVGRLIENLSNRLAKQIGQRAASAELRILAEMDRPTLLRLLNRLDEAAQGTADRQQLVQRLRELRRPRIMRPSVGAGTGIATAGDELRNGAN